MSKIKRKDIFWDVNLWKYNKLSGYLEKDIQGVRISKFEISGNTGYLLFFNLLIYNELSGYP